VTVMAAKGRTDPRLEAEQVRLELARWATSVCDTADRVQGLVDRLKDQLGPGGHRDART
jgi:hypothetical protein